MTQAYLKNGFTNLSLLSELLRKLQFGVQHSGGQRLVGETVESETVTVITHRGKVVHSVLQYDNEI